MSHPHVTPLRTYLAVWGALMILTAATVGAAQINLGAFNVPLALAIATVKGTLVALFFMHLLYDERFNLVAFASAVLFVIIFLALTVVDPISRADVESIEGREINPDIVRPETPSAPTTPISPTKH